MSDHARKFNEFIKNNLNSAQQKAVAPRDGVLLVIAGAGSGKTRVITSRILHLIINEGVSPDAIVALTFTNKAANEMKSRITQFLGAVGTLPFVGTFHSYCLRLLKENVHHLKMPFFSILDEDDQQKILSGIIQRNNLAKRTTAKQLSFQISQIKNQLVNPDNVHEVTAADRFMQEIYNAYEKEKAASRCLDFDDLLLEVLRLFKTNAGFKQTFQQHVKHLLVDEYQDTNVVQHELLQQLCKHNGNFTADSLCVVGDEDQSIYSWRGATVTNMTNFKKDFPAAQLIKIEQNYRSVQTILDVANSVIEHNYERNPKKLWSERKGKDRIRILSCLSEYQEGDTVAALIKQLARNQEKLSSVAIVYRAHHQSRALEEALIRNSIPYRIVGGIQFYERKEIKDLLAYLRLMVNPFDRVAFFRIINCPARGLGQKFEEEFYSAWSAEPFSTFKEIAHKLMECGTISGQKKNAALNFIQIFDGVDHATKPSDAVEHIIGAVNYLTYLKESNDQEEANSRIENVKELIHAMTYLESKGTTTLSLFLDEVALMQAKSTADDATKDAVQLMTLHAAKGLEFPTVVIAGLEEGLLPSSRSLVNLDALEEERRLLYVGITRAEDRLLITHSRYRYTYGTMSEQCSSRFLQEIPQGMVPRYDISNWQPPQLNMFFAQWMGIEQEASSSSSVFTFGAATKAPASPMAKPTTQKSTESVAPRKATTWKKNQPVSHEKFGIGTVQAVEERDNGATYVMVQFKSGKKKIDAKFLCLV